MGTIAHSAYVGAVVEYFISTPIGELFTTAPVSEEQYAPSRKVFLHFHPDELIILPETNPNSA